MNGKIIFKVINIKDKLKNKRMILTNNKDI